MADPVLCLMVWQNMSLCVNELHSDHFIYSCSETPADFMCGWCGFTAYTRTQTDTHTYISVHARFLLSQAIIRPHFFYHLYRQERKGCPREAMDWKKWRKITAMDGKRSKKVMISENARQGREKEGERGR